MFRSVGLMILLLSLCLLTTSGCTPPVSQSLAAPPDQSSNQPRAQTTLSGKKLVDGRVVVVNPAFNQQKPVLFDSGYEENNDSCMVCHLDFEKEKISAAHLKHKITCMGCHGDSEVHRADEYNIIRPDVIWGRAEMQGFCRQCHVKHKKPKKVKAFLEKWDGRRRPNGRWVTRQSVCLDCHGHHAIVPEEGMFK